MKLRVIRGKGNEMAGKLSKMAVMENMENNTQFMSEIDILCSITWEYNMFRRKFTHENWTHIWICKENDTTINQITNFAFERLKEKLDNMDFRFGFNYHVKLHQILNERFLYL